MLLKRFYDEGLAQASYLIGCHATGDAIVVDPNRDVAQYVEAAAREGLTIRHVTETHIHADFVSGARELGARTGATLYLSAEGGPDWQYRWAASAGATLVRDGDTIRVGNVVLTVRHTPGHTPEHLMFEVLDSAGATEPMGVLTGDFVFVGDVGRPDLLEKAAKVANTMEAGAKQLYASLQRFKQLPDWVQIWPGHGAGSACGKALGAVPTSTVGYERRFNWGLADVSEDAFVATVLEGQPEPPVYFAEMKRINRDGPRVLSADGTPVPTPPRVPDAQVSELLASGAVVIDTRDAAVFASGHLPGTLSIPLNKSFSTWAGWLVAYDRPFYLLADPAVLGSALRELRMIGLDDVAGVVDPSVLAGWSRSGARLETVPQLAPSGLSAALAAGATLVDVRGRSEWQAGHIPGARHVPLGELRARVSELPVGRPVIVQCQGGARSAIAASVLQAAGVADVTNLSGGYAAWLPSGSR
ncbi:MAG: rhodanese-like domain-containing protein [Gemmatimonadaceae bacterium]|nr:rhodanese-like domain-containing protein [Gemmatimonadaceae bacterium]